MVPSSTNFVGEGITRELVVHEPYSQRDVSRNELERKNIRDEEHDATQQNDFTTDAAPSNGTHERYKSAVLRAWTYRVTHLWLRELFCLVASCHLRIITNITLPNIHLHISKCVREYAWYSPHV